MSKQATGSKLALDVAANAAVLLLSNYSFDLGRYTAAELVEQWLTSCPSDWILLAAIEALYQGRYKAKSVEQILTIWLRRKQPLYHFNPEFEQLICSKLPAHLNAALTSSAAEPQAYSHNPSNKSNATPEVAPGKTDGTAFAAAANKELPFYGSPFDRMSGASVGGSDMPSGTLRDTPSDTLRDMPSDTLRDRKNVEPTETIPPQPKEQNFPSSSPDSGNQSSLLLENGKLTVADSWANTIGPIDQFEPAEVDLYLYTKLKTLADFEEEQASG